MKLKDTNKWFRSVLCKQKSSPPPFLCSFLLFYCVDNIIQFALSIAEYLFSFFIEKSKQSVFVFVFKLFVIKQNIHLTGFALKPLQQRARRVHLMIQRGNKMDYLLLSLDELFLQTPL